MHVSRHQFSDPRIERRVRLYLAIVVTVTVLPSVYMAYALVCDEVLRNKATQFVEHQFDVSGTHVADTDVDATARTVDVSLVGKQISPQSIAAAQQHLPDAGLAGAKLRIFRSGRQHIDVATLRSNVLQDLYKQS